MSVVITRIESENSGGTGTRTSEQTEFKNKIAWDAPEGGQWDLSLKAAYSGDCEVRVIVEGGEKLKLDCPNDGHWYGLGFSLLLGSPDPLNVRLQWRSKGSGDALIRHASLVARKIE